MGGIWLERKEEEKFYYSANLFRLSECQPLEFCETRSGPEYLLRKYQFFSSGKMDLTQFYYNDSSCSVPWFCVQARGIIKKHHDSWIINSATEFEYNLDYAVVTPYTSEASSYLTKKLVRNPRCLRYNDTTSPWKPNESHVIYHNVYGSDEYEDYNEDNFRDDVSSSSSSSSSIDIIDCLPEIDISFHELQLARMKETIKQVNNNNKVNTDNLNDVINNNTKNKLLRDNNDNKGNSNQKKQADKYSAMNSADEMEPLKYNSEINCSASSRYLLFGDVHTNKSMRQLHRPNSFQEALASAKNLFPIPNTYSFSDFEAH
ncbi:hypothetical protein HELRODRAFT_163471 [Helobdella robusta]|uniref:APCDD1 domain-containing protein n=1 Tax=Helobdella robusta TaxID=6412 RepID=T1EU38_HELRO|nr:hypothetical protein HELRODRAFT_163471 [Helobdella robusta]ESN96410.1 hypothetical protein HELRODRAFT_163471 [Helobdella robusta]